MQAWSNRLIAKVGAEGVYSAALPTLGLGLALKVHDGDMIAAGLALVALLEAITQRSMPQTAIKACSIQRPSSAR